MRFYFKAIVISLVTLLWPLAAFSQVSSLTVQSNAKEFSILNDGVRIGGAGDKVNVKPGLNIMEIASSNFIPRKILFINLPGQRPVLKVGLLPRNHKKGRPPRLGSSLPKQVANINSICRHPRLTTHCQRHSWFDDLMFAGFFNNPGKDSTTIEASVPGIASLWTTPPPNRAKSAHPLSYVAKAEQAVAAHPELPLSYSLGAQEALFKRECSRIRQLIMEASRADKGSPSLFLTYGLCIESTGHPMRAIDYFRTLPKSMRNPQTYFHLSRLLVPKNATDAKKFSQKCLKTYPGYYPCMEMIYLSDVIIGKKTPPPTEIYRTTNRVPLFQYDKRLRDKKRSHTWDKTLEEMASELPNAFEYYAHRIRMKKPIGLVESWLMNHSIVGNLSLSQKLLQDLQEAKTDPKLMERLYRIAFQQNQDSAFLMWGYAKATNAVRGCLETIKLITKLAPRLKKAPKNLYLLEASCSMKLRKFNRAEVIYKNLLKSEPKDWKLHYNLGVVYDAKDRPKKANRAYRIALKYAPKGIDTTHIKNRLGKN